MKLETPDGRLFTLNVDSYEFPDEELGPTDDNPADEFQSGRFLIVSHTFCNSDGEWHASGPTMTTSELQRLADWLESIRDGSVSQSGVYFTERDLEFTVDDSGSILRVHIFRDFLPSWIGSADAVTIDFPVACVQFDRVIESLRRQLTQFPGRPAIENAAKPADGREPE